MYTSSQEREYIFITKDPLGREVRLKTSTWNYHIINGDHNRTEFSGEEDTIKSVIENPAYILYNNPENPNDTRQKYIDLVNLESFESLKGLVIVVDHQNKDFGDIVTLIAKSKISESTKGGAIYERKKSTIK